MSKPYAGLGVWVWEAGVVHPDALAHSVKVNNGSWIAVKTHDGTQGFNSAAQIEDLKRAAKRNGLKFGIWGYLTARAPSLEADTAISLCKHYGVDFYIADAEIEYERVRGASAIFANRFRHALSRLPAVLSTFGRIDLHGVPTAVWRERGFDLMPQAYECESAELSPRACLEAAEKNEWSKGRVYPTLGTYSGARGVLSGSELHNSCVGLGTDGINIWDAQELHAGQLEALGTLFHKRGKHKIIIKHSPPTQIPVTRDLRLTSPLMRGHDVRALQVGINLRLEHHHQSKIKEDGIFGSTTHHALHIAAFDIGLNMFEGTREVQRLVRWPWLTNPVQKRRAKQREAALERHRRESGHGLTAIPKIAAKFIGVKEVPAGSNWGFPHPADWEEQSGVSHAPWCFCFASAMVRLAGGHVNLAYCPFGVSDAKNRTGGFDRWSDHHDAAGVGWLVFYDWTGDGLADHVGVVEHLGSGDLTAIEGNTSGSNPSDGGMVARMTRGYAPVLGYARPKM